MQQSFPLSQLKPSPHNVRKTGGASIADLAASIRHEGLINPLTVTANGAVAAGSRRLKAMQLLVTQGHLPADHPVLCTVVADDVAVEISLAENVLREAMHPADEFEAFQRLVTEGATPAEIAERLGTSERHVQQRLRLANLAPVFLRLYRDGNATQEQLMALSVTDDHEAQVAAWGKEGTPDYFRTPSQLRGKLLSAEITSDDDLAQFVGVDEYRAAGGNAREDLFTDTVILLDSGLVNRLAQAKLQAEADRQLTKGWGWAEARVSWPYDERAKYKQSPGKTPAALLGVVVTLKGEKIEIVTGLTKPGAKAPKDAKPSGQPKQHQHKADPMREANGKLEAVRLGLVRKALRDDPSKALSALTASLCTDYFNVRGDLVDVVCEVVGMPGQSPAEREVFKALDPRAASEQAKWQKAVETGIKKHGSVLQWLLEAPIPTTEQLLNFLAIEAVEPTEGYGGDKDALAKMHQAITLFEVDLATEWTLTEAWLQAQGKAYILAALEDAMGKAKAEPFAKLKADKLAGAAFQALTDAQWRPSPMRAPALKPTPPAKKAAKKTTSNGAKK